jgi:hypothetical protein
MQTEKLNHRWFQNFYELVSIEHCDSMWVIGQFGLING